MVGAGGFEPPTSCTRNKRATRLRYAPTQATKVTNVRPNCKQDLPKSGKTLRSTMIGSTSSDPHPHPNRRIQKFWSNIFPNRNNSIQPRMNTNQHQWKQAKRTSSVVEKQRTKKRRFAPPYSCQFVFIRGLPLHRFGLTPIAEGMVLMRGICQEIRCVCPQKKPAASCDAAGL